MSQRRCCCAGETPPQPYPCQPCPEPLFPPNPTRWRVSVTADLILCDSAGSGAVGSGQVLDCKRGGCGRQPYRRKFLGLDTFAQGVCDDLCEQLIDEDAPTDSGTATIEWTFCGQVVANDCPGGAYCPDVTNVQSPAVAINLVTPALEWNSATCSWNPATESTEDCRTVIEVEYTYHDSFDAPYYTDSGFCDSYTVTFTVSRTWICYYSRRVGPGQYYAEGQYSLVRCIYPGAVATYPPSTTPCNVPGGTVCSMDGLTPIAPPTTWTPPQYINLVRLG